MNMHEILEGMVNQLWLYNSKYHKILNYKITDDKIFIGTDKTILEFENNGEIDEIIKKFLPVQQDMKLMIVSKTFKNMPSLADIMIENIEKIKKDKKFIPQANAIKGQVDSILNMAKLEIQIRKMGK